MDRFISIDCIDVLVFDFDGVLTDNSVYIDESGREQVKCSRSDGLAFDVLRKINKPVCIISTEKNSVVSSRAAKLRIPVIQGVSDKARELEKLANEHSYQLSKILFVGNDLNDYPAMNLCGFTACPGDSHQVIQELSTFVLRTEGGKGVVRELIEEIFQLDPLKILFEIENKR